MSGSCYLLDSNILLAILAGNPRCQFIAENSPLDSVFYVSSITRMELLSYSRLTDHEEVALNGLFTTIPVVPLTTEIENQTIALRRRGHGTFSFCYPRYC